jgi:formylmethanofuran dehydrogenase subunit E
MCMEKSLWEKTVEFHGHICPGLAIGFRAASLALAELDSGRSGDEELVAIVENDACGVDAVQVVSGCTFGKGNFFFRDYGKQVYTFATRNNNRAVRVSVKSGAFHNPELSTLRSAVYRNTASREEKNNFIALQEMHIDKILSAGSESFEIKEVVADIPPKAEILKSVVCHNCGENVMETRIKYVGNQKICLPCSKQSEVQ